MATQDFPQENSTALSGGSGTRESAEPDRTRLEKTLVKGALWKKQTLREIEFNRTLAAHESKDPKSQTERMIFRLSAQLDERNDEIEQLRSMVSKLRNERTKLALKHRRELEQRQDELQQLQDAYNQFEKESDDVLSELSQKNERLLDQYHSSNPKSLLK